MSAHLLSPEQVAFRNARLLENLRQSFPELSDHSDEAMIAAYDAWFMSAEPGEDDSAFKEYLQEPTTET